MELKVWVDGIQRVVCGITDQTTVQEVVIALAQATGRTGRYTLVEQRNNVEKMLPPSERPLQVLNKKSDHGEVQFILRRTGASSVSGQDGVVTPERSGYRQSLPPQLKHRQKNDTILNRKEPKRKSLTISGLNNDLSSRIGVDKPEVLTEKSHLERLSENSTNKQPTPKKALLPPPLRNSSNTNQGSLALAEKPSSPVKAKKDLIIPPAFRQNEQTSNSKKKALIPPPLRGDAGKSNSGETPVKSQPPSRFRSKTPDRLQHRRTNSTSSTASNVKPRPDSAMATTSTSKSSTDPVKARSDFASLVAEQHNHIKEQTQTLKTITEEMDKYEQSINQQEKSSSNTQKEIETMEAKIRKNEADLFNEKMLEKLLAEEEREGSQLQNEVNKMQSEIATIDANVKDLEHHLSFLSEEISKETRRRKLQNNANSVNLQREKKVELEKMTMKMNKLSGELAQVQHSIEIADHDTYEKKMQLETLNRELRQVNLQQFIRQTGSKVTVLPPVAEKGPLQLDESVPTPYYAPEHTSKRDRPVPLAGTPTESGGVWV